MTREQELEALLREARPYITNSELMRRVRAALAKPIAHTNHPMWHFDGTCPACLVEQPDDWQRGMEQAAKIVEITAWKMGIRMTDSDPLASAIRAAASEQEEERGWIPPGRR